MINCKIFLLAFKYIQEDLMSSTSILKIGNVHLHQLTTLVGSVSGSLCLEYGMSKQPYAIPTTTG